MKKHTANMIALLSYHLGYVEKNMHEKALDIFKQMPIEPNNIIYTIVFKACTQLNNDRAKTIGMKLLDRLTKKLITDDEILSTAIIHMLMKFGKVNDAEKLFDSMFRKNVVTYGAMINGSFLLQDYIINKTFRFI